MGPQTNNCQKRTQTSEGQWLSFGYRSSKFHQSDVRRDWRPMDERCDRQVRSPRIIVNSDEPNSRPRSKASYH